MPAKPRPNAAEMAKRPASPSVNEKAAMVMARKTRLPSSPCADRRSGQPARYACRARKAPPA